MSDEDNVIPIKSDPPCEGNGHIEGYRLQHTELPEPKTDPVNSPPHYKQGDVEAIEIIEHVVKGYPDPVIGGSIWQVLKYLIRAPHKRALRQDLQKADWYLKRAIEHVE